MPSWQRVVDIDDQVASEGYSISSSKMQPFSVISCGESSEEAGLRVLRHHER